MWTLKKWPFHSRRNLCFREYDFYTVRLFWHPSNEVPYSEVQWYLKGGTRHRRLLISLQRLTINLVMMLILFVSHCQEYVLWMARLRRVHPVGITDLTDILMKVDSLLPRIDLHMNSYTTVIVTRDWQKVVSAISRQKDEPRQNKPTGAEVTALSVRERTDRWTQCALHLGTREAGQQRGERVWRVLLRPQAPSIQTYTVFKYTQERGVCVSW